jgi:hypothetical protein
MISKLKFSTAAALLALSSPILVAPAFAQDTAVVTTVEATSDGVPNKSRDEEMFEMIAKIFEVKDTTPIDPKRLAAANKTVAALLPNGGLAKMMSDMVKRFIGPMSEITPDMSGYEIMSATNVYADSLQELDEAKRKQITALLDPTRKERVSQTVDVIMPLVNETMNKMEVPMREGMSRAYARKFSLAQLNDLNMFFATPTGASYAAESYALQADPEVMQAMTKAMPKLFEDLKFSVPKIEKDVKKIPDAKNISQLNDSELSKLADLTGISLDLLKENRKGWDMAVEATAAASEAVGAEVAEYNDPFANESGNEPWYADSSWTKADRTKVNKLSKAADALGEKYSAATSKWDEAFKSAISASRNRYLADGWKPEPAATEEAAVEATEAM